MRNLLATCRLYGIVDMGYTRPEAVEATTQALIAGGVRIIQLRAKQAGLEDVRRLARVMQPVCRAGGALFVLNDYPAIAAELGADAVHVGQDAGPVSEIRRIVGADMIIGRSTHSPAQALAAQNEGADYIGFGPLFPTGTKPGRPAIGLQDIASVQARLNGTPMFCIGGVNNATLPQVLSAGAQRVVIVSWLLRQPDITAAARKINGLLQQ